MAERPALASVSSSSFEKGRVPHFRVFGWVGLGLWQGVSHVRMCLCGFMWWRTRVRHVTARRVFFTVCVGDDGVVGAFGVL